MAVLDPATQGPCHAPAERLDPRVKAGDEGGWRQPTRRHPVPRAV